MKTFLFSFLLLLILSPWVSADKDTQQVFRVGFVLPLSGPAADFGIAVQNAVHLASKDKPELFTNMKFLFEDTAYFQVSTGVGAFKKLAKQDKVHQCF